MFMRYSDTYSVNCEKEGLLSVDTELMNTFDVVLICNTFVVPITPVRAMLTGTNPGFWNYVSSLK